MYEGGAYFADDKAFAAVLMVQYDLREENTGHACWEETESESKRERESEQVFTLLYSHLPLSHSHLGFFFLSPSYTRRQTTLEPAFTTFTVSGPAGINPCCRQGRTNLKIGLTRSHNNTVQRLLV